MKIRSFTASVLLIVFLTCLAAQEPQTTARLPNGEPTATVEVLAFDSRGKFLGAPNVTHFDSNDHKNFATKFHAGIATGVPFGVYRIEAYLPAYHSEARYVRIYQRRATVVLGLTFSFELPVIPPSLHGRVLREPGQPAKRSFVKLSGVFSNVSIESPIDSDGGFDLVGLSDGLFILLVVGEDGVLASRMINIPYEGPPLKIEIGRDHPAPGR